MPKLLDDTVAKNRLKIEIAAQKLFTRQGFHGPLSAKSPKRQACPWKLYLYYPTKEDIFIGLVQRMEQKLKASGKESFFPLDAISRSGIAEETGDGRRANRFRESGLLATHVCRRS